MMKGFARIFEAIIASVIILTSLTFFFVPNIKGSEWEDTTIQILAQDALESIYLNGTLTRYVNTDNKTQLNVLMSQMLPKTVDFSFEVSGTVNNIINIVCVDCTSGDVDELKAIMNPLEFDYKERKISIRVQSLTLSINAVPSDTNILFFFNKNNRVFIESNIRTVIALECIALADNESVHNVILLCRLSWFCNTNRKNDNIADLRVALL